MNKTSIILIIAGIGLALIVGAVLYLNSTPHDFSIQEKAICKQYGGEWKKELGMCVNMDKEACELADGSFGLPHQLPADIVMPDDVESFCIWAWTQANQ